MGWVDGVINGREIFFYSMGFSMAAVLWSLV
jgi:hypothetical protein